MLTNPHTNVPLLLVHKILVVDRSSHTHQCSASTHVAVCLNLNKGTDIFGWYELLTYHTLMLITSNSRMKVTQSHSMLQDKWHYMHKQI